MPFALIFIGMVLVVTGLRDTYKQMATMIAGDFTGQRGGAGFIMFFAAIAMVGALGAVRELRSISHAFLALIIVSLLLHNAGFMQKLLAALRGTTAATPVPPSTSASLAQFGGGTAGTGLFGGLGSGLGVKTPLQVNVCNSPSGQCS
jgi:hypothetical protein